jgi:hypothetical protein
MDLQGEYELHCLTKLAELAMIWQHFSRLAGIVLDSSALCAGCSQRGTAKDFSERSMLAQLVEHIAGSRL